MAVFVKVVETSSFAATARYLGMSPAMVSRHIQLLEERLGARLLNRTTRRVSLTEVGQIYHERCLRILSELEEADRAASELQSVPRGRLRVTAPMTFGIRHLAPIIADYLRLYPEVAIDLSLDDRCVDLLEEGFDLAIRVGALADSSLIARRLTLAEMVLCASPDYLKQHGIPKTPRDLEQHNCLAYAYSRSRNEWRFIGPSGTEETIPVSGRFVANNGDALRIIAREAIGIIVAPQFVVEEEMKAGHLVRLLPEYRTVAFPVHAVYPHSRYLSAKARTFIDFLVSSFNRSSPAEPETADQHEPTPQVPKLRVVSSNGF
jgi:DNA-binding transcriptional LysR family regulator